MRRRPVRLLRRLGGVRHRPGHVCASQEVHRAQAGPLGRGRAPPQVNDQVLRVERAQGRVVRLPDGGQVLLRVHERLPAGGHLPRAQGQRPARVDLERRRLLQHQRHLHDHRQGASALLTRRHLALRALRHGALLRAARHQEATECQADGAHAPRLCAQHAEAHEEHRRHHHHHHCQQLTPQEESTLGNNKYLI